MPEQIKVTTEELLAGKESCESLLKQIKEEFITVEEIVAGIKGCFGSEALLVFQKQYQKRQDRVRCSLESVAEHVERLGEIEALYSDAERSNTI